MLYNYSYLHLGPIFFKCIGSYPHFFLVYFIFFNLIQPWFFLGFTSFLKNWQTWSFLVRFPRLCQACFFMKMKP